MRMTSDVLRVGCVDSLNAHVVRIVHISDTHMQHKDYCFNKKIPDGDVLVHSGDFAKFDFLRHFSKEEDYLNEIKELNEFFTSLPHKYKIFVAGNHETNFQRQSPQRTAQLLSSCIYLQDSWVTIEGIKFYGTPWNGVRHNSFARGFGVLYSKLPKYWKLIPDDTDVLISHSPPFNILDVGMNKHPFNVSVYCTFCDEHHKEFRHFGCPEFQNEVVKRIRPKAHLFGHVHERNGTEWYDGILFSNGAFPCTPSATVIDYYIEQEKQAVTDTVPQHQPLSPNSQCSVM